MCKPMMKCEQELLRALLYELYPPLAPDAPEPLEEIDAMNEADDLEPYDEPYEYERK